MSITDDGALKCRALSLLTRFSEAARMAPDARSRCPNSRLQHNQFCIIIPIYIRLGSYRHAFVARSWRLIANTRYGGLEEEGMIVVLETTS